MEELGLQPHALYHLTAAEDWAAFRSRGAIVPPSLADEGFVHCSWGSQVLGTLAKHFAGVRGLLALRIDPDALGEVTLVVEDSYGSGQAFPHAYGPIPVEAVVEVVDLDGSGPTGA